MTKRICDFCNQEDGSQIIIQPISTNARYIEVASTILSGYHRSNMTGFNADNAVLEIYKTERSDANGTT